MAKKKAQKISGEKAAEALPALIFTTGGHLADGTRFEKGEEVPADLSDAQLKALHNLGAIDGIS